MNLRQLLVGELVQLLSRGVGLAGAHAFTGYLVCDAESHALAHQPLGYVGGQGEALRRQLGEACGVESEGGDHPGDCRQQHLQGVDRVERGLLVLLQVSVVGQRQRLQGGQQTGQVPDQPSGLAAGELCNVGVLLLRHDGAAGGVRVVEGDEPELLGGPDDDLFTDARQVDADHGRHPAELRHQVPGGGAVDGVLHRSLEAQLRRHLGGVQTERGPGQGPRSVGRVGQPRVQVTQPLHIPQQRPRVGQQMVGQQDRLGVLQVGAARHRRARVLLRLPGERVDDVEHPGGDAARRVAQVHPDHGGDLVVAGAASTQLASEIFSGPLQESALQGPVDVLIRVCGDEAARRDVVVQPLQRREHTGQLVVTEQLGAVQHPGVGLGAGDVVGGELPVEVRGLAQRRHDVGRAGGEAAAPERAFVGAVPVCHGPSYFWIPAPERSGAPWMRCSRSEAVLAERPNMSMKPRADDWSKVSPVS